VTLSPPKANQPETFNLFAGGGEMGALMRSFDWSATPLGPPEDWPHSLRTAVSICLSSRFPIVLWWGPDLRLLYNDAWRPALGALKHPALAKPGREVWREIWHIIGPMLEGVLATGQATWQDDQLLPFDRYGYLEETYWTYSYSPIHLDTGEVGGVSGPFAVSHWARRFAVSPRMTANRPAPNLPSLKQQTALGGVFTAVQETTQRVVDERRLATLRDLVSRAVCCFTLGKTIRRKSNYDGQPTGAQPTQLETANGPDLVSQAAKAQTTAEACRQIIQALDANPSDVPFALLYLLDADGNQATLAGCTPLRKGTAASPDLIDLKRPEDGPEPWPLADAARSGAPVIVADLRERYGDLPSGPWPVPPREAVVLPLRTPGQERLAGFLVVGVNPGRALDDSYRGFFDLVAEHTATAINNAHAYEEERRRAEALAEIDRAKTAFFSNVSHEFRTPLTLMLGPVEDILAKPEGGVLPANRELLTVVHRNGQRLLKLVNTLLDFARLEAGRVQAVYEPTDLAAFTTDLASNFRSACEKAGLRLRVDCPPLPEPVYVDRDSWEKIVLNLLSNAFKYTFQGEIGVALRSANEHVELTVRDTGIGIPATEVPRLFERFHRVQGARGRTHEGSGIGLALVQELARLHGGSVRVESVEGQGTTFTVTLPRGKAHLPPDRIQAARTQASTALGAGVFVEEALRWLPNQEEEEREKQKEAGKTGDSWIPPSSFLLHPSWFRPRILLADDNADMRDYVRRLLSQRYEVEAVPDGQSALEAARRRPPDLVLSDVMMPRLDGFGLLRALRGEEHTRSIPIILLSARAGEEARVEGLEKGADDYLIKPFSARELVARVGAHLELARVRREASERVNTILESITDGFVTLDCDWRYVYVNAEAERLLGRRRVDLLGKTIWEMFPGTVGTQVEREARRVLTEKVPAEFEIFYEPWGRWYVNKIYPTKDGGLSIFFQDVTERKRAEDALRESEQRFRALADAVPQIVWTSDETGRVQFVNHQWREFTGLGIEETRDREKVQQIIHPEDVERVFARWAEAFATGNPYQVEFRARRAKDGVYRWLLARAVPIRDEHGQIREWFGSSTDVDDLKRLEEALREADRRKDEFLATLAHELRNPLAPIRNSLAILRLSGEVGPATERVHEMLERQVAHLVRLVDDLLEISRITRGKIELRKERVELTSIVQSALETSKPLLERAGHNLHVSLPTGPVWLEADPVRLAQVLANLLNNAANYTEEGGQIWLTAHLENGDVAISVRDSGLGIPPEMLPQVFELFAQVDRNLKRAQGGLGIGLALVKSLVQLHGGRVEAHSEGPGKGSEFIVRLPLANVHPTSGIGGTGRNEQFASSLPALRVLVVDDNRDAADSLGMLLRFLGADAQVVYGGAAALEAVRTYRPRLVLLDLGMPGMDGFEVAQRLRQEEGCQITLIALTGWGQEEDRRRSQAAGFDYHLVKPVNPEALQALLSTLPTP
jgi:PAS domain S-box-containing protein